MLPAVRSGELRWGELLPLQVLEVDEHSRFVIASNEGQPMIRVTCVLVIGDQSDRSLTVEEKRAGVDALLDYVNSGRIDQVTILDATHAAYAKFFADGREWQLTLMPYPSQGAGDLAVAIH